MATKDEVDEGLYSRQLYVFGHEAQRKMQASNILLIGLRGVGVEIAKNLILSGVKSVTLFDQGKTEWTDLSSQFYLGEKDIGRPRAEACADKLAELNPRVNVTVTAALDESTIKRHQVLVCTECDMERKIQMNAFCRAQNPQIRFIAADVRGVFARVFCDFGDAFVVTDTNGEPPASALVEIVTKANPGIVTTHDGARHGLESGDFVTFDEVKGMTGLNGSKPRPVKVMSPYSFSIEDTSGCPTSGQGGYFKQVKQPKTMSFKSLADRLADPGEFLGSDFSKFGRSELMHLAWQALDAYQKDHNGSLPTPSDVSAHKELIERMEKMNDAADEKGFHIDDIDDAKRNVVRDLARCACGQLSAMAAVVGGIVAQEVLKASSGKFTPISQWFYFDAAECLPDATLPPSEFAQTKSRYDGQIAVFGQSMQKKILSLSYFLVGAGAIGCEMLKSFAMMGLGCGSGMVHVTDMDCIERSNLSRQFLFREKDIKKPKSVAAAKAAKTMNPNFRVKSWETRVGPDTENVFNDDFWDRLDGCCNALDNREARLYMDSRCVFYNKPLLESGTQGTKGNTQVVVPGRTENYGAQQDQPDKGIPICTLKNFPYKIEHTIQWARDCFEGGFVNQPTFVNEYLRDPEALLKRLGTNPVPTLEQVHDALVANKHVTFDECIVWARTQFEEMFANTIRQLLYNFPKDQVDSDGNKFWSGHKRCPDPVVFDMEDKLHMDFIVAAANLRAEMFGLKGSRDRVLFRKRLPNVRVAKFVPKDGVKIAANEKEAKKQAEDDSMVSVEELTRAMLQKLPTPAKFAGYRMCPLEFEKDDDSNFHMDFVTAVSNLRARCYRIKELDMHHTKKIAGKIIPAIATTTALVSGMVSLELYKILQGRPIESYRNAYLNLAIPLFALSEPMPPLTFEHKENKWSIWDKIDIKGPMTLRDFVDHFEKSFGVEVSMVTFNSAILYSGFMSGKKRKERLPMTMEQVAPLVSKRPLNPLARYLNFEVMCCDPDADDDVEDDSVEIPTVRYRRGDL
eukprot:g1396.t1